MSETPTPSFRHSGIVAFEMPLGATPTALLSGSHDYEPGWA